MKRVFAALLVLASLTASAQSVPLCRGVNGYADASGGRRTFLLRPHWLETTKIQGQKSPVLAAAWKKLFERADAALGKRAYSVVNKTRVPPSGDKHDYISMGPYWWPDPKIPGGEPYLRRDGEVNPERDSNAFDVTALEAMSSSVEVLALAYYFSDDRRYAIKAAELLRTWFLAPATRMNANASFAQGVPGRTPGRAEGVLDTFRLIRVVESIGLIGPSGALTSDDQAGLEKWFAAYAEWMTTSTTGREEGAAGNNHGLWYDYQLVEFSLFARRADLARSVAASVAQRRFARQIEPDGRMPLELQRTRAFHYTVFALQAATGLADLGRCVDVDLWHTVTADGRGLERALDFLVPYVGGDVKFPYPDLGSRPKQETFEVFARASWAHGNAAYRQATATLARADPSSVINLTIAAFP